MDDLAGKKIGTTSGYLYSDAFAKHLNDTRFIFEAASNDEANFQKLLSGRIDVFPMERNVGVSLLKNKFTPEESSQITFAPRPVSSFQPHLLLSKAIPDNKARMTIFDQKLGLLKKDNRYFEIMKTCVQ